MDAYHEQIGGRTSETSNSDGHQRHPGAGRGRTSGLRAEFRGVPTISITLDTYSHVLPGMDDRLADAMGDALG